MDNVSREIMKDLQYTEERCGIFTLFYKSRYTNVCVCRSHEGYNHFAQWYVKLNGKIKESMPLKERERALQAGYFVFYEQLSNQLQKIKGMAS